MKQMFHGQIAARFRRWLYLLTQGMWRGECGFTVSDAHGVRIIGSGRPLRTGVLADFRIWWERKEKGRTPHRAPTAITRVRAHTFEPVNSSTV